MKNLNIVLSAKIAFLKKCGRALVFFVFPSHCLHCGNEVEADKLLCFFCSSLLELAQDCQKGSYAFCMEPIGPCLSLVHAMKGPMGLQALQMMASFMVVQMQKMQWPMPDYLMVDKKTKPLAIALGSLLDRPVIVPSIWSKFFYKITGKQESRFRDKKVFIILLALQEACIPQEILLQDVRFLAFLDAYKS